MPNIYTTPKIIKASVSTDMLWQGFSQYVDPIIEEDMWGEVYAVNLMNYFIYPLGLALFAYVVFCAGKNKGQTNEKNNDFGENLGVTTNIFLAMMGWMVGYTLAYDQEMGRWGVAALAGVGSAIPLLLFNYGYDKHEDTKINKQDYAVASVLLTLGGFLWATAYDMPGDFSYHHMPEWAGGIISIALTGIFTGGTLLAMKAYEDRQSNYKQLNH